MARAMNKSQIIFFSQNIHNTAQVNVSKKKDKEKVSLIPNLEEIKGICTPDVTISRTTRTYFQGYKKINKKSTSLEYKFITV
jgi:ABC-type proline/glycine betaine transport system substrate-binding protein